MKACINECWTGIDRQKIRFLQSGSGPPMLLLHGLLGGSFCWRFSLPALARKYSVHAVDLPGLAFANDAGTDCSMSCQAERLLHFIEQMRWDRVTVMGCSFGGAVAMLLAARDADLSRRIQSLILVAPVNPWSEFGRGRIRLLSSALGGCFLRAALPISHPFHGIAVRRMFGDARRMPPDTVKGYRASILQRGRAKNVLTALRSWRRDVDTLREIIPQLRIPVLLIWGDHDGAVDPRSAPILQQKLSQAELKFIPGAGHLPFEELPDEFNRAVLEFLDAAHH